MRILFLTQYFPPETGAAQNRIGDLARRLADAGHDVSVLTSVPSYPKGKIFEGYRGRLTMRENIGKVHVERVWIFATQKKTFVPRIINYLSFAILALIIGLLRSKPADFVIAESPPLFVGLSGFILAKVKGAKFILNISDLWPESAVILGMLRNPWIVNLATDLEEALYKRASAVTGQTVGIIESIRNRCPETPCTLLTNGGSPEFFQSIEVSRVNRGSIRQSFGFADKFIVAYTGVHGLAQGLETVLFAAEVLLDYEEIQFVFLGDGPEKPQLQKISAEKGLRNVRFLPTQPASRMPDILCAIDASVITLRRAKLFEGALPSKLFEALGAGVPAVVAIQGEARVLTEQSGGGLAVEPENPRELADAVLKLYGDPGLRQELARSGQAYIAKHHNRKEIAARFEQRLFELEAVDSQGAEQVELKVSPIRIVDESKCQKAGD